MAEEMQKLKDLVAQLTAENQQLLQERAAAVPSTSVASSNPVATGLLPSNVPGTERLVYVPRDRKCPMFRGRTGLGISEWSEEVQACMRARHLSTIDQAYFIYDHLEGEAKEEIKYRPRVEREDPVRVLNILQELYGCSQSYVTLQEEFFSRKQQEGETLQEFSHALMCLMERVGKKAPSAMPNSDGLLRDQFVENVYDCALRRELKQLIRRQPNATLLEVRSEAIRWEREGMPGGSRGRSHSVPSAFGIQYAVQGRPPLLGSNTQGSELAELKEILKRQQEQLNQLTHSLACLQNPPRNLPAKSKGPIICRRCQQPGHFARQCDGVRVPPQVQPPSSVAPRATSRSHTPNQPSEN